MTQSNEIATLPHTFHPITPGLFALCWWHNLEIGLICWYVRWSQLQPVVCWYLSGWHQFTMDSFVKGQLFSLAIFLRCLEKKNRIILKLNIFLIYVDFHYWETKWTEDLLTIALLGNCMGHNTFLWFDTITKNVILRLFIALGTKAQLVKFMLCKHKDLNSVLRTPFIKKVQKGIHSWHPSARETGPEGMWGSLDRLIGSCCVTSFCMLWIYVLLSLVDK